jgi:hypothetical protein
MTSSFRFMQAKVLDPGSIWAVIHHETRLLTVYVCVNLLQMFTIASPRVVFPAVLEQDVPAVALITSSIRLLNLN